MIRIFVTLVVVAALGHVVNSRPQNFPFDPSTLLGTNNSNNGTSAAFDSIPANQLNTSALSGAFPALSGQMQTKEPNTDRKKRSPERKPVQELISSYIPNMYIPTFIGKEPDTTEKPSAN
jgi:hypothetical protein